MAASCFAHVKSFGVSITKYPSTKIRLVSLHTGKLSHRTLSYYRRISPQLLSTRTPILCNVELIRLNSTLTPGSKEDPTAQFIAPPSDYIPSPPPVLSEELTESLTVQETLNALGEPTLSSLGLGTWTPSGLYQNALELLHINGLPWWAAIALSTLVIRVMLFPVIVKAQRNAARMHNHMPTITRLQEKFTEARYSGNLMEAVQAGEKLKTYTENNKISFLGSIIPPLVQAPIFISVFWGLKGMANAPVASLAHGGILWFTDLTLADPFYLLPLMTMGTLLITLELGSEGVEVGQLGHVGKWILRGLPFVMFPMIAHFPVAMSCYWMTSNVFSLIQLLILRTPRVREYFNIEKRVQHEKSALPKKGFSQGFSDTWKNSKKMSKIENRARYDAVKFKEAGSGPLVKTYSHNPTKVAAKSKS